MNINDFSKDSIAIIYNDSNSFFAKEIQKLGVQVFSAYKPTHVLSRVLRRIHFSLKLPNVKIWFMENQIFEYINTIIIFDVVMRDEYILYLSKKYPKKRLILWYWNPVRKSINPDLLNNISCEKWSYSIEDCEKFNLRYNTTFYFFELANDLKGNNSGNPIYDVLFVGRDKGRLNILLKFKEEFETLGLKTKFHITPTKWYEKLRNNIYRSDIGYDEIINLVTKSRAILDVVQDQGDGLTLRVMESLFFKKKLITNNTSLKNYDFYDSNNIFILGSDSLDRLKDFMEIPFAELSSEIVQKYDFRYWLSRFNKDIH